MKQQLAFYTLKSDFIVRMLFRDSYWYFLPVTFLTLLFYFTHLQTDLCLCLVYLILIYNCLLAFCEVLINEYMMIWWCYCCCEHINLWPRVHFDIQLRMRCVCLGLFLVHMSSNTSFHSKAVCCIGLKHIWNELCLTVAFGECTHLITVTPVLKCSGMALAIPGITHLPCHKHELYLPLLLGRRTWPLAGFGAINRSSSPILVTERWAQSWSRCTGSQPTGDFLSDPRR